jgi:hypothetical protein
MGSSTWKKVRPGGARGSDRRRLMRAAGEKLCYKCPSPKTAVCNKDELSSKLYWWVHLDKRLGKAVALPCSPHSCAKANKCKANRKDYEENILCGECEDGFVEWGEVCVKCGSKASPLGVFVYFFMFFTILVVLHFNVQPEVLHGYAAPPPAPPRTRS